MDKNIIKIIGLVAGLIVCVGILVYLLIAGIHIGPINAVSISGITKKSEDVENAKLNLEKSETSYDSALQALEKSKKEFNTQKEAYELISDEKINAVKEATKEEEYLIEYVWITLGNYATKHNLSVTIVEPGGNSSQDGAGATSTPSTDPTSVSNGTGSASGATSTNTTGASQSGQGEADSSQQTTSVTSGLTASADALTVQIKGSYIDLADFIFEVENDKSLRFRLDNIKMSSAGGTDVITSFNVKDFTVLKSLETTRSTQRTNEGLNLEH